MAEDTETPLRLLSCGEVLWDLFDGERRIGGAAFNLAAHAARCGLEAHLLSRVGNDALGQEALQEVRRLGVAAEDVQLDTLHPTGTVTVALSAAGQPTYTIHAPVAWDFITADEETLQRLAGYQFDALCFGTLAQRSDVSRASLQRVLEACRAEIVFFDVNLRQQYYTQDIIEQGLAYANVLKLSDEELPILASLLCGQPMEAQAFAQELQRRYPHLRTILITQGGRGCLVADDGDFFTVPGKAVAVLDAVGAGDAFSAAFLAARLHGKPTIEAVQAGNALGAYVVARRGAVPTD